MGISQLTRRLPLCFLKTLALSQQFPQFLHLNFPYIFLLCFVIFNTAIYNALKVGFPKTQMHVFLGRYVFSLALSVLCSDRLLFVVRLSVCVCKFVRPCVHNYFQQKLVLNHLTKFVTLFHAPLWLPWHLYRKKLNL